MDKTNTTARHWNLGLVAPLTIATILALAIVFTWGHESAQPAEATGTTGTAVTVTYLNFDGGPGWGFADVLFLVRCVGKDSTEVPACAVCNFDKDPRIGFSDILVVMRYQYSIQHP